MTRSRSLSPHARMVLAVLLEARGSWSHGYELAKLAGDLVAGRGQRSFEQVGTLGEHAFHLRRGGAERGLAGSDDGLAGDLRRRVDRLAVPARGELKLAPRGHHLMLMGLKRPLKAGDTITVHLRFEGGAILDVPVPVTDTSAKSAMKGEPHANH